MAVTGALPLSHIILLNMSNLHDICKSKPSLCHAYDHKKLFCLIYSASSTPLISISSSSMLPYSIFIKKFPSGVSVAMTYEPS